MHKKFNPLLKEILKEIKPSCEELKFIDDKLRIFLEVLSKNLKEQKIDAEVFVGGSYAKHTMIRKNNYDVDIFLRFSKNYSENDLSKITRKALSEFKNVQTLHGSRDYFKIKAGPSLFFEIVPVMKIKRPEEARNITDLSYSHVKYINKKAKPKILDDIMIAKAFCYANNCYGAESYINGFSGYGLELLILYYGGFLKFIKSIVKNKESKVIIDMEKYYKNKRTILLDLNESKLQSPIILIDPTYKQRNALAALSSETFIKFRKKCEDFLKSPSIKFFKEEKTNLKKVKNNACKKGLEFLLLEIKTNKQEGDIAGSKLLKFYKHLEKEIKQFFEVKKKGFNYNGGKSARCFFVVDKKRELILNGPDLSDIKNLHKFRKRHKNIFKRGGRVYARERVDFCIEEFIRGWKKKNKKHIKEMSISSLRPVKLP